MVTFLFVIGFILVLVGGISLLIAIFQESILWGLISLLFPIASWVYVFTHWQDAKRPFLTQMVGVVLIIAGAALAPAQPVANSSGANPQVHSHIAATA